MKEQYQSLLYLKGLSFLSEDNKEILWNIYKEVYKKEYPGNRNCQECIRTELRNMLILTSHE